MPDSVHSQWGLDSAAAAAATDGAEETQCVAYFGVTTMNVELTVILKGSTRIDTQRSSKKNFSKILL